MCEPALSCAETIEPLFRFGMTLTAGPCVWGRSCVFCGVLSTGALKVLAARNSLSPWRRTRSNSFLVVLTIFPFFLRGAAGQYSCSAGKGPWQLAHLAFSVQLEPEGPTWRSRRVLQLLQRE